MTLRFTQFMNAQLERLESLPGVGERHISGFPAERQARELVQRIERLVAMGENEPKIAGEYPWTSLELPKTLKAVKFIVDGRYQREDE